MQILSLCDVVQRSALPSPFANTLASALPTPFANTLAVPQHQQFCTPSLFLFGEDAAVVGKEVVCAVAEVFDKAKGASIVREQHYAAGCVGKSEGFAA